MLHLVHIDELDKGPAAVGSQVVDARHPVGVHGQLLVFGVFASVTLDFDDKVQQVVGPIAVVNSHDEVGAVLARLRAIAIRHLKAQVVILDVGHHARVAFGHAAELGLPITVKNHPVDLALGWRAIGFPTFGLRGVEVDKAGSAGGVVRVQHRLDGPLVALLSLGNGSSDAVAGLVGQFLVHQLRWVGVTLAIKTGV